MGKACQCRQPGEWTINSRHACMQAPKVGRHAAGVWGLVAETTTPTSFRSALRSARQRRNNTSMGKAQACFWYVCVLMTVLVLMSFTHGSRQPLILRLKV